MATKAKMFALVDVDTTVGSIMQTVRAQLDASEQRLQKMLASSQTDDEDRVTITACHERLNKIRLALRGF